VGKVNEKEARLEGLLFQASSRLPYKALIVSLQYSQALLQHSLLLVPPVADGVEDGVEDSLFVGLQHQLLSLNIIVDICMISGWKS
jgi:hypothetical protein